MAWLKVAHDVINSDQIQMLRRYKTKRGEINYDITFSDGHVCTFGGGLAKDITKELKRYNIPLPMLTGEPISVSVPLHDDDDEKDGKNNHQHN